MIKYRIFDVIRILINLFIILLVVINLFPMNIKEIEEDLLIPGFVYLFFGGIIGILFFLYSVKHLHRLNIIKSLKQGSIGCFLLGLNYALLYFVPYLIYFELISPIYYLNIVVWLLIMFCYCILGILLLFTEDSENESFIRKTILDLGTNYTRLKISEIAEKSKSFHKTIVKVVKNMITNNEIYAEYFSSSESVAFNLQENLEEIDRLMDVYKKWEVDRLMDVYKKWEVDKEGKKLI